MSHNAMPPAAMPASPSNGVCGTFQAQTIMKMTTTPDIAACWKLA